MNLKDKIQEEEEKLNLLHSDLGKLYLEFEKKKKKIMENITYTKVSIDSYRETIHSNAFIKIEDITPYLVRLLSNMEETKFDYHKANLIMIEDGKITEKKVHMISKFDEVKNSYNVNYPYNDERNDLRDSHLFLGEHDYIEFYDRSGNEIYFLKQYPYLEYFIDEIVDTKEAHGVLYTSYDHIKEAYNKTIEKYGFKQKVKKL